MSRIRTVGTVVAVSMLLAAANAVADDGEPADIIDIAVGSKEHTTLVAAVKAADYVGSLKNPGPLTVFAPVNAAFAKLPKGTVETLLKPENQLALEKLLQYHVTPSTYLIKDLKHGMTLGQANGKHVKITIKEGQVFVNDAKIVATVKASNGVVHVIDGVLLPPKS